MVKNLPDNEKVIKRHRFSPWVGKITWRKAQQPTSVPAWRLHGTEEPGGSQGHKESDTTEAAQHTHMHGLFPISNGLVFHILLDFGLLIFCLRFLCLCLWVRLTCNFPYTVLVLKSKLF